MKNKTIFAYSFILLAIGGLCRFFDTETTDLNSQSPFLAIWVLSPILVMLLMRLITNDWKDFGLNLNLKKEWKWYLISILIFPIVITITLLFGKITGTIIFTSQFSVQTLIIAAFSGFIPLFIKNILEEFSWRGYLTPKLDKQGLKPGYNHLIVGFIWGLWHLPYLDLMIRSYSTLTFWIAFPLFFLGIIALAFVYGEIRLRSKTVWTAVLLHTIGNTITNPLIYNKMITLVEEKEYISTPGVDNLVFIGLIGLIAIVIYKKSK